MFPHSASRPRQTSSTASSTLFTSSTASSSESPYMTHPTRASSSTSRSIFSDTEAGTEVPKSETATTVVDHERPLIDLDDTPQRPYYEVAGDDVGPTPTPGEKLRMLLRQMEAEVRSTTPAPPLPATRHRRQSSSSSQEDRPGSLVIPTPSASKWRQGRRGGGLPMERKYTPPSSPDKPASEFQEEEQEEEEILEDSPPTPPLRAVNPYLYASRKVSDERRSSSPRQPSRAAVLHASTSRSPPPDNTPSTHPTALQNYLARAPPISPSRKGKERASPVSSPPPTLTKATNQSRRPARTPRKWSVELAPDDSVLFAQGLEAQGGEEVELDLDLDESVEPPWTAESSDADDSEQDEERDEKTERLRQRRAVDGDVSLPELPDLEGDSWAEGEESIKIPPAPPPPTHRPPSRNRSRISSSPSVRRSQSPPSFTTARSNENSHSRSVSFSRRSTSVPPVEPVLTPEPVHIKPRTPPRVIENEKPSQTPVQGQTPRPPGAWFSASKLRSPRLQFSPLRQVHTPSADSSGDLSMSIHKIKLSPAKSPKRSKVQDEEEDVGNTSFTRRLVNLSKSLTGGNGSGRAVPAPSTTLAEAQAALDRAARASALARRKVEYSQKQWIEARSMTARTKTAAVEVLRQSWTWGRWAWWISLEIMLLWGVFRVTMEYATVSSSYRLDPAIPSVALSIPLPTALSAFVIPPTHRRSANFFDLLEQMEVWRYLDKLGVGGMVDGELPRMRVPI